MSVAPIALFVYNRPEHTSQTIESLRRNVLATQSDLFIFSDAAKSEAHINSVNEVRQYIRQVDGFKSIKIIEREVNFGLAKSIVEGVTLLCNQFGNVIVLEDDLVTSPYFLQYMNEALKRYSNETRVMQISGYMFSVEICMDEDAFFLPLTTSWGWATWQRSWCYFDASASGYQMLSENNKLRDAFDLEGAYKYYKMLESYLRGEIDSWAIRWYLSVFMQHGLTLYPVKTLVFNTGFDGSGTNCGISNVIQTSVEESRHIDKFNFPSEIEVSIVKSQVVKLLQGLNQPSFIKKLIGVFR